MNRGPDEEVVEEIGEQVEDLCHIHNHVTRVIANIEIDNTWFDGYDDPDRAKFDLEGMVLVFLYKYTRELSQKEMASRLKGVSYLSIRFGLHQPPTQQSISHNKRERFNHHERLTLKAAAERIREICIEHDLITEDEPALDPEDIQGTELGEELIMDAVELATEHGFTKFSADRASNSKYELEAYFERQGFLNMANAGITTPRRRFARLSERSEVPHGSSHNRTMKKISDPGKQTSLTQFSTDRKPPEWRRIRNELLPAFHAGVTEILDEMSKRDRNAIRNPVKAALDITPWNFWPSPYKDRDDVKPGESPIMVNGEPKYPKENFPEMVSGLKDKHERGYKFATLTIIAQDTPIVLAIEPVRDESGWETGDVEKTSRAEIVDRLITQAQQHVDIHKLFADKEFGEASVREVIDSHDIQYILAKAKRSNEEKENADKVRVHPTSKFAVGRVEATEDNDISHDMSYLYDTAKTGSGKPSLFVTNALVTTDRGMGLTNQYRKRWMIENEYKTIKKHYLPTSASSDYRIRFLYFVIGVIMYNVWRFTNFFLRDEVMGHLGEKPPIRAGEIIEIVAFCLFDPGD